jgi:hypothetical protein
MLNLFLCLPTQLLSFSARNASSECRNDGVFDELKCGGDDGSSGAREVVPIGSCNTLDQPQMARGEDPLISAGQVFANTR